MTFLDAKYNFRLGRIENAEPGTWAWWHEKGHEAVLSVKVFGTIHKFVDASELLLAFAAIILLALGYKWWALQIASTIIFWYAFLEVSAWTYALLNKKDSEEKNENCKRSV